MLFVCNLIIISRISLSLAYKGLKIELPSPQGEGHGEVTKNQGFNSDSLLYNNSRFVSLFRIFPPANFTTACPAAVSHSMVGAKRG